MRLARDRTLYRRFRLGRRIQARVALALALLLGIAAVVWPGGTATGSEDTGAIQPGDLAGLTLVFVDTSHGEGVDLWTAAFDGEMRRLIARFPLGARVLDMDGPLVAVDLAGRLLLVDLRTGEQQELDVTVQLRSALVRADGTVFYTTGFGCRSDPLALAQPSRLIRVDATTDSGRELDVSADRVLVLLQDQPTTGELYLLPRGCDVGIGELRVVSSEHGGPGRAIPISGCGWAQVAHDGTRAVVGWQACTPPEEHAGALATVYDLGTGEGRDIRAFVNVSVAGEFLFSPDGATLAFGGSFGGVAGPLLATTGSIWLADIQTLAVRSLWQGAGSEAQPLDWSPDGRFILVQGTEAQGRCSFTTVDATTGELHPVVPEISHCGANGAVLGWTVLE